MWGTIFAFRSRIIFVNCRFEAADFSKKFFSVSHDQCLFNGYLIKTELRRNNQVELFSFFLLVFDEKLRCKDFLHFGSYFFTLLLF